MGYYIIQDEETRGPYTLGQLRAMWGSGAITTETLHCQEGCSDWLPLSAMTQQLEAPLAPVISPAERAPLAPAAKKKRSRILGLCLLVFLGLVVSGTILWRSGSEDPQKLLLDAATSLRNGSLVQAARTLNRVISERPSSPQAHTVGYIRSFLRDGHGDPTSDVPLTEDEAKRLAELFASYEKTGAGRGLGDFASSMARIADMRMKARQEMLEQARELAKQLDMSAEESEKWLEAAEAANVSMSRLANLLMTINEKRYEARTGIKAAGQFDLLGIPRREGGVLDLSGVNSSAFPLMVMNAALSTEEKQEVFADMFGAQAINLLKAAEKFPGGQAPVEMQKTHRER